MNPKQETLSEGQLGNYVRLPFPGALAGPFKFGPQQIIEADGISTLSVQRFVPWALDKRTPIATLEHIASLYKEPERPKIAFESMAPYWEPTLKLKALAKHLFEKPVDQISDRSMHIEAFVRAAKDSGLTASETLTLADELAARCGKFSGRADRETQLRRIVERAWT